jgi:uncharacterized membrane-anchored protein YhcB (DUF1043 family)
MSGNLTDANLKFSEERQEETLNQISELQELEKKQYEKLVKESAQEGSAEEMDAIITEINKLSDIRANLFKTLTDMYSQMQNNVAGSRVNLVNQLTLVETAEQQLNQAKAELIEVTAARDNKMRMVEINTYYSKRYKAHTSLMKVLIMVVVPILILAILNKKGFLSYEVTRMLATLVGIVGAYFVIAGVWDLMSRDNMEYDEYDWAWSDPSKNSPTVWEYNKKEWNELMNGEGGSMISGWEKDLGIQCYGEACCNDNMKYNKKLRKCEDKGEGFRNKGAAPNYVSRDYCEYGDRSTVRAFDPEPASFARV